MNLERLVLGTVGIGGVWEKVDADTSVKTILTALEQGIGAIDTAPAYGDAEHYLGKALKAWKGTRPVISSKAGRLKSFAADQGFYDYSTAGMQKSIENTLRTLGIDSLDILFLHDPAHMEEKEADRVIDALLAFREKGYAGKIGLGGNPPSWMQPYLRSGVFDVLMEFNKLNACNTVALSENLLFCIDNKIQYYSASPLNMGLLGNCYDRYTGDPPPWLDSSSAEAAKCVKNLADLNAMELRELAHRFLMSLPYPFNIVIGPSNLTQLSTTLADFRHGPLPPSLVNEIINGNTRPTTEKTENNRMKGANEKSAG